MRLLNLVATAGATLLLTANAAAEVADAAATVDGPSDGTAAREETVTITGARAASPSLGALGSKAVVDTPFSISTYDADLIKDLQATTLTDLLKLEPAATVITPPVTEGTTFELRGFQINDYYVDSIPGIGAGVTEPTLEFYDNVQLLKGAAGFLYGFTSPGGVLNLVSKRPTVEPFLTLDGGFQQDSQFRGHLDTSISAADGRLGARLNIVGEDGRNRYIGAKLRRYGVQLNTDARLTPTTTFQLDLQHSRRRLFGDSYGFWPESTDVPVPKPISGANRLAPDFSNYRDDLDRVAPALVQQLGSGWIARLDASWSRTRRDYHDSEFDNLDAEGNYSFDLYTFNAKTETRAGQLLVSGTAHTGPLGHALAFGAYYRRAKEYDAIDTGDGYAFVGNGNIHDPLPNFADPGLPDPSLTNDYLGSRITEKALFASDTVSLGAHWQALLGLRYVWRDQADFDQDGSRTFSDRRSRLTPTAALLYKPVANVTTYVSYAQSLQPGRTAPANASNANQQFPPIVSKQYEIGAKAQLGGLLITAAAFRIEEGSAYLRAQPASPFPLFVQDGIERHDGAELGISGRIGQAWRLGGGLQWLDPTIRKGDPELEGKTPVGVPRLQAKLYGEYAPPALSGAAVNATIVYSSGSFLDPTDLQHLDGFTTIDAGARYSFKAGSTPLTLRASLDNILAKRYWIPGLLMPGAPRTLKLSAEVSF